MKIPEEEEGQATVQRAPARGCQVKVAYQVVVLRGKQYPQ